MNDRIPEILTAFEAFDGTYRRKEVDAALALQEEITPHLIAILEKVLSDPAAYAQDPNYFGHIYAVELLGHFREPHAHDVIVNLFSLSPKVPYDLFGEIVTEDLPAILFATCGGSVERIKTLLLNRAADGYCRSAAAGALVYAAVEGIVSRKEVVVLFGSLFTGREVDPDPDFRGFLANSVCDLYPEELMDVIKEAFDAGLISERFIDYPFFEETLRRGKTQALQRVKDNLKRYTPTDVHDRMSWWACFRQKPASPAEKPAKRKKARRKKFRPRPPRKKKRRRRR